MVIILLLLERVVTKKVATLPVKVENPIEISYRSGNFITFIVPRPKIYPKASEPTFLSSEPPNSNPFSDRAGSFNLSLQK